ncbi:hypothetical protein BaRGS_00032562 [Batillaria attramentaria]|uniref:5'-nucleotidase n=1 Tax=Batillaria attramentaria TaxID=370345 RepID=A0ABD0JN52_9CAEN
MAVPKCVVLLQGFVALSVVCTCLSFNLTILHTNDVHSRYDQTNKYSGQCSDSDAKEGKCFGGMARLYTKVQELRAANPNTVLVDAGDQYQGTIWFFTYGGNITAHFMNRIGYDVMALGNHEFDLGPEGVRVLLNHVNFPVLSANTNASATPDIESMLKPSVVKDIDGQKVGFIGYTTVDTIEISKPGPISFTDEAAAIQREVNRLTAQGVNKIIAVGHAGYPHDIRVASEVTGLDVIVGGHTNTFLYNGTAPADEQPVAAYPTVVRHSDGSHVLVVQDYAFGKYLGFLQVEFDEQGQVAAWSGNPILLDNTTAQDPDIAADVDLWRTGVDAFVRENVGRTAVLLDGGKPSCRLAECNMGNLITDAALRQNLRHSDGLEWNHVALALINSGSIRSSLPKGDISVADVLAVQPFQNIIDIVELNGSSILLVLEHSASRWDPDKKYGGFLQTSGILITYDMSKPIGQRVQKVKVRCADCEIPRFDDLELSKVYKVVMSNFIVNGGDGYDVIQENALRVHIIGDLDSDVLTEYIRSFSPIIHGLEGRIRFVNSSQPSAQAPNKCRDPIPVGKCIVPCGTGGADSSLSVATVPALLMTLISLLVVLHM